MASFEVLDVGFNLQVEVIFTHISLRFPVESNTAVLNSRVITIKRHLSDLYNPLKKGTMPIVT